MKTESNIVQFMRVKVDDLEAFMVVHRQAVEAQRGFGITESLYQSTTDPKDITVQMIGSADSVSAWLESEDRARLATQLSLSAPPESWETREIAG